MILIKIIATSAARLVFNVNGTRFIQGIEKYSGGIEHTGSIKQVLRIIEEDL